MLKHLAAIAAIMALAALSAGAATVWSQQWDTTPVNPPAAVDQIRILADTHTGLTFGDPLTNFVPYGSSANVAGWTSTLVNSWEVDASGPEVVGQDFAFNINFDSPLSAAGYLMFLYYDQGQLVAPTPNGPNPQQWFFDGTGQGNNPVASWVARPTDNFGQTPEPATMIVVGGALIGFAVVRQRQRQRV